MTERLFEDPAPGAGAAALRNWPSGVDCLAPGWRQAWSDFAGSVVGAQLNAHLQARLAAGATIYPPEPLRVLALTPPEAVRVVILGQDPYHGPGQANGLAFSVARGVRPPPSLRNILKELARDLGAPARAEGLLERWARQGVLLLNTSLTVEQGAAASHAKIGWQALTGHIIQSLIESERPLVFMLWGAHAQAAAGLRLNDAARARHLLLQANHPSPLSALRPPVPFIGCGHFGRANRFFAELGQPPIDWLG